MEKLADMP